jgi:hypothetical protein
VLFCAMLRWQPWESRHHLPLFVLGASLGGLVLERHFSERMGIFIAAIFLLYAMPFAMLNRTRSLIRWHRVDDVYHPRSVLYFNDQHEAYAGSAIAAAEAVNSLNCRRVTFDSFQPQPDALLASEPESFFIYPLFALIHADAHTRTVWYSGVHNLTTRYRDAESHGGGCAVVCLQCATVTEKWAQYRPVGPRASVYGDIVIFGSDGQMTNTDAAAQSFRMRHANDRLAPPGTN